MEFPLVAFDEGQMIAVSPTSLSSGSTSRLVTAREKAATARAAAQAAVEAAHAAELAAAQAAAEEEAELRELEFDLSQVISEFDPVMNNDENVPELKIEDLFALDWATADSPGLRSRSPKRRESSASRREAGPAMVESISIDTPRTPTQRRNKSRSPKRAPSVPLSRADLMATDDQQIPLAPALPLAQQKRPPSSPRADPPAKSFRLPPLMPPTPPLQAVPATQEVQNPNTTSATTSSIVPMMRGMAFVSPGFDPQSSFARHDEMPTRLPPAPPLPPQPPLHTTPAGQEVQMMATDDLLGSLSSTNQAADGATRRERTPRPRRPLTRVVSPEKDSQSSSGPTPEQIEFAKAQKLLHEKRQQDLTAEHLLIEKKRLEALEDLKLYQAEQERQLQSKLDAERQQLQQQLLIAQQDIAEQKAALALAQQQQIEAQQLAAQQLQVAAQQQQAAALEATQQQKQQLAAEEHAKQLSFVAKQREMEAFYEQQKQLMQQQQLAIQLQQQQALQQQQLQQQQGQPATTSLNASAQPFVPGKKSLNPPGLQAPSKTVPPPPGYEYNKQGGMQRRQDYDGGDGGGSDGEGNGSSTSPEPLPVAVDVPSHELKSLDVVLKDLPTQRGELHVFLRDVRELIAPCGMATLNTWDSALKVAKQSQVLYLKRQSAELDPQPLAGHTNAAALKIQAALCKKVAKEVKTRARRPPENSHVLRDSYIPTLATLLGFLLRHHNSGDESDKKDVVDKLEKHAACSSFDKAQESLDSILDLVDRARVLNEACVNDPRVLRGVYARTFDDLISKCADNCKYDIQRIRAELNLPHDKSISATVKYYEKAVAIMIRYSKDSVVVKAMPSVSPTAGGKGGNREAKFEDKRVCFKCGKPGHIATYCTGGTQ